MATHFSLDNRKMYVLGSNFILKLLKNILSSTVAISQISNIVAPSIAQYSDYFSRAFAITVFFKVKNMKRTMHAI